MWFSYVKSDSPQRHRGTEKCFKQAWLNLPDRKILNLVIPCLTLSLLRTPIRWNPVAFKSLNTDFHRYDDKGFASLIMLFSVSLCLCGEAFKSKASQP